MITATEGGRYDAINMYDRCIITGGLIQYCEAGIFLLSGLLAEIIGRSAAAAEPVLFLAAELGYEFGPVPSSNKSGVSWRFYRAGNPRMAVDTQEEQKDLFLGCSGLIGSWGPPGSIQRMKATRLATAFATVLAHPASIIVQNEKAARELEKFYMPFAIQYLLEDRNHIKCYPTNIMDAAVAIYSSFAANLPAVAATQLQRFATTTKHEKYSRAWLDEMCWHLTYGSGITIYPERYNKIRPVVERLFNVDLPDFATDLLALQADTQTSTARGAFDLSSVVGIQRALIELGFDLGPKGADGISGPKTRFAIMAFQFGSNLVSDGIVGPKTKDALQRKLKLLKPV